MDSMTTSTPRTDPAARSRAAFSLPEVIIAASLSGFVLAAVLSSFLFLGRSGFRASRYAEIEGEIRRGLETFARDARAAADIRWHGDQSITLIQPAGAPVPRISYGYDAARGTLYRLEGDPDSALPRRDLIRGLASDFSFRRYKLAPAGAPAGAAANDLETKQVQIVLRSLRGAGATAASQAAVSARYILRNKRVAN